MPIIKSISSNKLFQNAQSTGWQSEKNVLTQPSSFMAAFLHIQTLNHFNEVISCECSLSTHCATNYSNFQIKFACHKWTVINSILNCQNRTDKQSRANWNDPNQSTVKAWWTIETKRSWQKWLNDYIVKQLFNENLKERSNFIVQQYLLPICNMDLEIIQHNFDENWNE